ncbi:hypothetical protein VTK26DRAFT_4483 [Humicola hyalothermophila]
MTVTQPTNQGAPTTTTTAAADPTVHLPRLICLHGFGTNAAIMRIQCRALAAALSPHFRLLFPDAPFPSPPGPGVEPVFSAWAPFRSWVPVPAGAARARIGERGEVELPATAEGIDAAIRAAVEEDERRNGATGEVVGVLGFSQGARVAGSLLLREQRWRKGSVGGAGEEEGRGRRPRYRFAVLMAGRGPFLDLVGDIERHVQDAALRLPTLHVHGLRDQWLEDHRALVKGACEKGTAAVVEWDGDHRLPSKAQDVAAVVKEIVGLADVAESF